jgi:hypothetical protein
VWDLRFSRRQNCGPWSYGLWCNVVLQVIVIFPPKRRQNSEDCYPRNNACNFINLRSKCYQKSECKILAVRIHYFCCYWHYYFALFRRIACWFYVRWDTYIHTYIHTYTHILTYLLTKSVENISGCLRYWADVIPTSPEAQIGLRNFYKKISNCENIHMQQKRKSHYDLQILVETRFYKFSNLYLTKCTDFTFWIFAAWYPYQRKELSLPTVGV